MGLLATSGRSGAVHVGTDEVGEEGWAMSEIEERAGRWAAEFGTDASRVLSKSRKRRDCAARALLFNELHDRLGWSIRKIAEETGHNRWAVHSAVFHSVAASRSIK